MKVQENIDCCFFQQIFFSLEISSKKVGELYKTAHALQVASVAQACARYLIKNLSVMDCIGKFHISVLFRNENKVILARVIAFIYDVLVGDEVLVNWLG